MIKSISIKNLALVSSLDVEWTEGLNVLAGETGAGKSILFDALSIVLGARAGASLIRPGEKRASIEAIFSIDEPVRNWLQSNELFDEQAENELMISREITSSSSRSRVNGAPVNMSMLGELRSLLLTFHAQHEIRTLLEPQSQLDLLDGLGNNRHRELKQTVRARYLRFKELSKELSILEISEADRAKKLDFAEFQLEEITRAAIDDPMELDTLRARRLILENARELEIITQTNLARLTGSGNYNDEHSSPVKDILEQCLNALLPLKKIDPNLQEPFELLESSLANLEEGAESLRRYSDNIESDQEALQEIEERLDILASVKRKYGPELSDVLDRKHELENEIFSLENAESDMERLKNEIALLEAKLLDDARKLSLERKSLASKLESAIVKELKALGMDKCRFKIEFQTNGPLLDMSPPAETTRSDEKNSFKGEELTAEGLDRIEFLISANPGQPLQSLARVASGGELSRIMLALKSIFASADKVPTVVFDEIDAGLGGKVLNALRDKLVSLSASHQILCITHQPVVAAVADNFVLVTKEQSENETLIQTARLCLEERKAALAVMASGKTGEAAMEFAGELLNEAKSVKSSLRAQLSQAVYT